MIGAIEEEVGLESASSWNDSQKGKKRKQLLHTETIPRRKPP
jgi:hypothetical protein